MLIRDMLNEVNRELSLRKQVFPRLIKDGRLTNDEADERMDRLTAVRELLLLVHRSPELLTALNAVPESTIVPISIKGGAQ